MDIKIIFIILISAILTRAYPLSGLQENAQELKELQSQSEESSFLFRTLEFISFLMEDEEMDQDPRARDEGKYVTPEDILNLPLVIPSSSSNSQEILGGRRVKREKHESFYLFDLIPYMPEEIPWSNEAYKNPGVYGGGWGTQHIHPVVFA